MAMKKRNLFLILGGVALLVIFIVANLSRESGSVEMVQAEKVSKGELISEVTATGSIQASRTVQISADVSAKIVSLPVKEGDLVSKGDVLVRLDQTRYAAAVGQAEASLAAARASEKRAEASLLEAQQTYERSKELYAGQLISKEQYTQVQTNFEVAKANLESAQYYTKQQMAGLEEVRDALSKTTITSPIDGTVIALNAEVGEIVMIGTMNNAGTVIMTVADLSAIEVEVEVDETDVAKLQLGQKAKVKVDAFPDTTFRGEVIQVGNAAKASTYSSTDRVTNFAVKILITDDATQIKPGMTATADIEVARRTDVIFVPIQAVVMRPEKKDTATIQPAAPESGAIAAEVTPVASTTGKKEEAKELEGVFRIVDGVAKFVPVKTGVADQQNIEIVSGLAVDEEIVSGSYKILRTLEDGAKVKVESTVKESAKK